MFHFLPQMKFFRYENNNINISIKKKAEKEYFARKLDLGLLFV